MNLIRVCVLKQINFCLPPSLPLSCILKHQNISGQTDWPATSLGGKKSGATIQTLFNKSGNKQTKTTSRNHKLGFARILMSTRFSLNQTHTLNDKQGSVLEDAKKSIIRVSKSFPKLDLSWNILSTIRPPISL